MRMTTTGTRWFRFAATAAMAVCLSGYANLASANPPQYEQTRGVSEFAFGAEVTADRAYFYSDSAGCPRAVESCKRRAYIVRGDIAVVTDAGGNAPFVKAFYLARADSPAVVGFLRRSDLRVIDSVADVPLATWVGRFAATPFKRDNDTLDNSVEIRIGSGNRLHLRGDSVPAQNGSPLRGVPDARVEGPLTVTAKGGLNAVLQGNPRGRCDLSLALIGPYLAIDAAGNECGGDGGPRATMQGLYLRAGATTNASAAASRPAPAAVAPAPQGSAQASPMPAPASQRKVDGFTVQNDTKRHMGSGYRTLSGAMVAVDTCRAQCAQDAACKAFEFKAGVPNESHPSCMLLNDPGSDRAARGYVSGVRN